jgi:hypothetical protein
LKLFERATVIEPIPFGQHDVGIYLLLRFSDETAEVATTCVGGNHHPAFALFTLDLVWAGGNRDIGDLPQGYVTAVG